MKGKSVFFFLLISVFTSSILAQPAKKAKRAEILVLSTMHQYHDNMPYYSFDELSQIIEKLRPDVLAVELTPADLKTL